MNPVVTQVEDLITFRLTDEDLKTIAKTKIREGSSDTPDDIAFHSLCIMQLVGMVSSQAGATWKEWDAYRRAHEKWEKAPLSTYGDEPEPPAPSYSDHPICVSEAITSYLIELNDHVSDRRRTRLKEVIPDILNTCPVRRKQLKTKTVEGRKPTAAYHTAEKERKRILARVPITDDQSDYDESISMDKRLAAARGAAAVLVMS